MNISQITAVAPRLRQEDPQVEMSLPDESRNFRPFTRFDHYCPECHGEVSLRKAILPVEGTPYSRARYRLFCDNRVCKLAQSRQWFDNPQDCLRVFKVELALLRK